MDALAVQSPFSEWVCGAAACRTCSVGFPCAGNGLCREHARVGVCGAHNWPTILGTSVVVIAVAGMHWANLPG